MLLEYNDQILRLLKSLHSYSEFKYVISWLDEESKRVSEQYINFICNPNTLYRKLVLQGSLLALKEIVALLSSPESFENREKAPVEGEIEF